jgi:hypothetical protein
MISVVIWRWFFSVLAEGFAEGRTSHVFRDDRLFSFPTALILSPSLSCPGPMARVPGRRQKSSWDDYDGTIKNNEHEQAYELDPS